MNQKDIIGVAYARTASTGGTIAEQLESLTKLLTEHGCTRIFKFSDIALSGVEKEISNKNMQKALNFAADHKVRYFAVHSIGIIARSYPLLTERLSRVQDAGVEIVTMSGPWLDLELVKEMVNLFSKYEKQLHSRKVKIGIAAKRRKGHLTA